MFGKLRECCRYVMNFTGEPFYAYACDGTPIMIMPQAPGTEIPEPDCDCDWALVVDKNRYLALKASGRPTHDLARLDEPHDGVRGLPMQVISEYDDANTRIMPTNCVFRRRRSC